MKINKLFITADKKEVNDEERSIVAWGSKPIVDRDRELIKGEAWELDQFRQNPVLMLSHDYRQPPVGKVLWVKNDKEGLKFKAQFAKTQTGKEIYELYKEGIMRAFSVGFIPKKWDDNKDEEKGARRIYSEVELLEISCVSVPSCPDALITAYNEGKIKTKEIQEAIIHLKPEETDKYIRIPVADCKVTATIDISEKEGIKALYCGEEKKVHTYLFEKAKDWTMEKAKAWVKEHGKKDNIINLTKRSPEDVAIYFSEKILEGKKEIEALQKTVEELQKTITELKEGRVLSGKNRTLVQTVVDALNKLLAATEPAKAKDIDLKDIELPKKEITDIKTEDIAKIVQDSLKEVFDSVKMEQEKTRQTIDLARGKVV